MTDNVVSFRQDAAPAGPHSEHAEQCVLGSLLTRNALLGSMPFLAVEHFAYAQHGRLFDLISRTIAENRVADPITLEGGEFDRTYLVNMAAHAMLLSAPDYARTVHNAWRLRKLVEIGQRLRDGALDLQTPVAETLSVAEQELYDLADTSPTGGPKPIAAALQAALEATDAALRGEGADSIRTGLLDLDRVIGGLRAPRLYILAGRPAMGKTTVATTIALEAARSGAAVLFLSMEMSADEISWWLLANVTGIAAQRQEKGDLTAYEFDRLAAAKDELGKLAIQIDDASGQTMATIRGRARKFRRRAKGSPALVIVDHLGLIEATPDARRQGATAEVTEITRALKVLAKDLDTPVLALCQLNRALESRDDKRPTLADLRQSGSIEQDADAVVFVYRPEYYLAKSEPERKSNESAERHEGKLADWQAALQRVRGLCQLIVAKQRGGPEGFAQLAWQPERSRVANLARGLA